MTEIIIHDWILECNVEATSEAYSKTSLGSAETCPCIYCKNFVVLRDDLFQGEFLKLLKILGVDYEKDAEIYEATLEKGKHQYAGWFHCIGKIKQTGNVILLENGLKVYFIKSRDLMFDVFKGENLIQIEFLDAILPWGLDELPPK